MKRRKAFTIEAFVLTGVLCIVFLLWNNKVPQPNQDAASPKCSTNHAQLLPKVTTGHTRTPAHRFRDICHQNLSAANVTGFSTLPGHLQAFLYYQHCKSFPMLLDLPLKCGGPNGSADVFLLLVIKSSPVNYERRQVLRETWAEERAHMGARIRRVFVSGTTGAGFEKRRLNKLLQLEHKEYGDVLQWDFEDSFFNLTLKQVLFLGWMEERCPRAHFLLNGDDDIFAHTDNMVEFLRDHDGSRHLFVGTIIENVGPIRQPNSKYFVPVQVQKSESYPPYCGGGGYLLSGHTAMVIYNASKSIGLHPIDDVYMGMCLARAGLRPVNHRGVRTAGLHVPSSKVDSRDPCYYQDILLVHRFLPHQIYIMWNQVRDPALTCWQK
ncbi:unnamed protein product [Lota lota]